MSDLAKQTPRGLKDLIKDPAVTERFVTMLGEKQSTAFLLSVLNCAQGNDKLMRCEPQSVLMAAAVAGTLNLPVDPSLGQAYIIPYGAKAQFQLGYRGLIQLAHRSGQYSKINVTDVRQGETVEVDRLTGETEYNWVQDQDEREKLPVVGYVAFFALTNGFSKSMFSTNLQLQEHGKKYSKTYKYPSSKWKTDFPAMAKKTVLKLLVDKYGPKTVEMQKAIKTDQAIVGDFEGNSLNYADNANNEVIDLDELNARKEKERVEEHIKNSKTLEMLEQCYEAIPDDETRALFEAKKTEIIQAE